MCSCWNVPGNSCTCKNGAAQVGEGCPFDGAVKCAFCNIGWTINPAKTACTRTRENTCHSSVCVWLNSKFPFKHELVYTCTFVHIGESRICERMVKFNLNKVVCLYVCCHLVANTCRCKNGVATTGTGCPVDALAKCQSCNIGWTLNHASTKCTRTCSHFRSQKQTS